MKNQILIAAVLTLSAASASAETVRATITDHYATIIESQPYNVKSCTNVEVPIYKERTVQGDAAAGALGGMIIGGILGKGLSGGDDGAAAAGAVLGGVIGADKSQTKTERYIAGYRTEKQCDTITKYREVSKSVYDYTSITWTDDGKTYTQTYVK